MVRSYGQQCGLARALDVVGDRWSLLIVRELSLRPSRYTDLRDGLPGVATNLLADRLRALAAAGVVVAEDAPPPVAATVYRLTSRGEELLPALTALTRWGAPLVDDGVTGRAFRPRWVAHAARSLLEPVALVAPDVSVVLDVQGERTSIIAEGGQLRIALADDGGGLRITCEPDTALRVLAGELTLTEAERSGRASVDGDDARRRAFTRLTAMAADERGPTPS